MLKFPRSKNGSPIPAYSQSTIRIRSPSSMKLAFSRSLWHGRSSTGLARHGSSSRRDRRGVLDLSRDPKQVRVVAREPDHVPVRTTFELDQKVAVRDPARERGQGQLDAGQLRDTLHRRDELVPKLAP